MSTLRVPDAVFTPNQDAEKLRKAFQGFGTDEEAVIWVLGHRNASQRKKSEMLTCSFTMRVSLIVSTLNSLVILRMR
ncbi:hypothetical protein LWI29_029135 [Acer saccharum]|uniref:Annexin n=1 Tax=Acer saccharum TaxID=4024 RepID=A0AA39RKC0_ACESA|nr:hypothetical protein LWI29_029135 [Acer saccharum]